MTLSLLAGKKLWSPLDNSFRGGDSPNLELINFWTFWTQIRIKLKNNWEILSCCIVWRRFSALVEVHSLKLVLYRWGLCLVSLKYSDKIEDEDLEPETVMTVLPEADQYAQLQRYLHRAPSPWLKKVLHFFLLWVDCRLVRNQDCCRVAFLSNNTESSASSCSSC